MMNDEAKPPFSKAGLVSVPDAKPRTVRVNITVPVMTLKQIYASAYFF